MPSSSKRKLVIGNWKMNPDSSEEAKRIIKEVKKAASNLTKTDVVACPPFVFAHLVLGRSGSVALGAQDVFAEERGSHTGEVSALMLRDIGAEYVIIGHSERRAMGETDEVVARKEIRASLAKVTKKYVKNIVMAYEPIWAIGAKDAMDPAVVQEMMIFIRKVLSDMYGQSEVASLPILYGGSVNFRNAGDILEKGDVDGFLVGRESVNPPGFVELLKVVDGGVARE
ncbi:triosephosphate isomerase [bacterium]|nr:triosephosphate isomerase [bacterium]